MATKNTNHDPVTFENLAQHLEDIITAHHLTPAAIGAYFQAACIALADTFVFHGQMEEYADGDKLTIHELTAKGLIVPVFIVTGATSEAPGYYLPLVNHPDGPDAIPNLQAAA